MSNCKVPNTMLKQLAIIIRLSLPIKFDKRDTQGASQIAFYLPGVTRLSVI